MNVSVIIPVYNAQRFVEDAVRSALAQDEASEVLLIDDGSSDRSLEVCQSLADEDQRIRVLCHPDGGNHGPGATRNLGVRAAGSEYICFLDADDLYLPGRFRRTREVFKRHPDIDGVYEAVQNRFDSRSQREAYLARGEHEFYMVTELIPPDQLFEALVAGGKGFFVMGGLTVRKSIFDRVGFFDVHLLRTQDTAMWVKMAALGRLMPGSLTEPVCLRRVHGTNLTVACQDEYPYYHTLMWETLIRWGNRHRLPIRRKLLLLEACIMQWCRDIPDREGWQGVAKRLHELAFLARIAGRHPLSFRSLRYYRELARVLGVDQVVKRCLGRRLVGRRSRGL